MRCSRFSSLLLLVLLTTGSVLGQKAPKPLVCGTSPAMERQQVFLHQRARESRDGMLRAGRTTVGIGGHTYNLQRSSTSVSGDIVVMGGDGGVILGNNPFPSALWDKQIRFQPQDAAATTYVVGLDDQPYREDAIGEAAQNLMAPPGGPPIGDDDTREFDLPFPFPMFGETHTKLFVNSNGHITFGAPDADDYIGDLSAFLSGPPKIAGATLDLDPSDSPVNAGIYVYLTPTEGIVSFVRVARWIDINSLVDFQIRFTASGEISIVHRRSPVGIFVMGITPGENRDTGQLIRFLDPPAEPIGQSIAEIFSQQGMATVDILRASQVFYQNHPDDYDFLVFYNNDNIPTGQGAVAFAITVRSQTQGIGEPEIDRRDLFGSPNRLQLAINMGPLSQYPSDPNGHVPGLGNSNNTPLSVIAHEIGHRFLAYPLLRENDQTTIRLLGRQLAHWSFRFNANGSFLEGSDIISTGDNTYVTGKPNERFAELDQYLMGLIPPEQVGVEQSLFYVGGPGSTARPPEAGVTILGPRQDFSIDDIIAANGPRLPDHTISQRRFRIAFVLVTRDPATAQAGIDKLDTFRREFVNYFSSRVSARASVDTEIKPGLRLDAYPAMGILAGTQGNLEISRPDTLGDASLVLQSTGQSVQIPADATIPSGTKSVTVPMNAFTSGVTRLRVDEAAGSYLGTEAAIVAASPQELSLTLLSPARLQAAPNSPASQPVRVRAVNPQGLPFQGVTVHFEPLTGGSANPPVATTGPDGEASFAWTVGSGVTNTAKVFIEGAGSNGEVQVVALEDLFPDLRAATNGASFDAGISPGSLATLFGISLAAGRTALASSLPLPTELDGVRVRINGVNAQLLFVSDMQINFYVPPGLSSNTAQILVTTADGDSNEFSGPMVAVQPGIFFDAGTNLGAVLPAGSGVKTDLLPAKPGEFIEIFATGLGPIVPGGRGQPARTQFPVTAFLGEEQVQVDFSGLAPGFIGLYQVNARIPENLSPGTHVLRLEVEGFGSNEVNIIVGTAGTE